MPCVWQNSHWVIRVEQSTDPPDVQKENRGTLSISTDAKVRKCSCQRMCHKGCNSQGCNVALSGKCDLHLEFDRLGSVWLRTPCFQFLRAVAGKYAARVTTCKKKHMNVEISAKIYVAVVNRNCPIKPVFHDVDHRGCMRVNSSNEISWIMLTLWSVSGTSHMWTHGTHGRVPATHTVLSTPTDLCRPKSRGCVTGKQTNTKYGGLQCSMKNMHLKNLGAEASEGDCSSSNTAKMFPLQSYRSINCLVRMPYENEITWTQMLLGDNVQAGKGLPLTCLWQKPIMSVWANVTCWYTNAL